VSIGLNGQESGRDRPCRTTWTHPDRASGAQRDSAPGGTHDPRSDHRPRATNPRPRTEHRHPACRSR